MQTARYAELFRSESCEHITRINRLLLTLEAGTDERALEELFRAVHTLKGMSAAVGLQAAAEVAHALEGLLDRVRGGELALDEEVAQLLFGGADALERAIDAGAEGTTPDTLLVVDRLRQLAHGSASPDPGGTRRPLRVSVHVDPAAPMPGVRAVLLLRRARGLGEILRVEPSEERLQAGHFRGELSLVLATALEAAAVREALLAVGELRAVEVEEHSAYAASEPGADPQAPASGREAEGWVRVRSGRLDALVDGVGELMVTRDHLHRLAAARSDQELEDVADQLARMIAEMRDEVMRLRMAPLAEVFERFPRLVRDIARSLGKRIDFQVEGAEVEMDRSLLHEVGELLVHLLRNAVDHGIEDSERRLACGKPAEGRVRLRAAREHARVVIRVEDDGGGVQRDRVAARAAVLGWASTDGREPTDAELLQWLSRPGFSTAERVTQVSGRGVGLDAVASRLESLGGALELESAPGEGTSFVLRLPVSLSIARCLLVRAGGEVYALPVASVVELVEVDAGGVLSRAGGDLLATEAGALPLIRLDEAMGAEPEPPSRVPRPVAVLQGAGGRYGVLVDAVLGQHESLLKRYDPPLRSTRVFAGAVLLPDGRPALVLDAHRLQAWARRARAA